MSSLETLFKGNNLNMYRSLCPTSTNTTTPYGHLHQSMLSVDANNHDTIKENKNKNLSFKYQRVDNMFKLVEVKSNHNKSNGSDPKEQTVHQEDKLQKLNHTVHDLTNRIMALQFQQAKIPGIERKLNDHIENCRGLDHQYNYLSQKLTAANKEVIQFRERLEEIEQQEGSYARQFSEICKLVKEIKEEASLSASSTQGKDSRLLDRLRSEMNNQIEKIKGALKNHEKPPGLTEIQDPSNINSVQKKSPNGIKFKYRETYENQQSVYCVNEISYILDKQGRLLDSSGFVILDKNNKQIRLNEGHIKKLRDFGLLS